MSSSVDRQPIDLRHMPIEKRIDWVIERAHSQSLNFTGAKAWLERNHYFLQHPTSITAFVCMDGRVSVSLLTDMPRGIIRSFRNLGGRFDVGWPHMGQVFSGSVVEAARKGRTVLCLVTYHYSKSEPHRGCAGFQYDTDAARAHAFDVVRQLNTYFGGKDRSVFPLVLGIETDEEAFVFHGINDSTLDLSSLSTTEDHLLTNSIVQLYPDMQDQLVRDLLPIIKGNRSHIEKIRHIDRSSLLDHREWMICIGHGFDWLRTPNLALIIGPYSPDLAEPICKAASIIDANMKAGRIPDDGFLLFSEAPYRELRVDRARAELESAFLSKFSAEVIQSKFPELAKRMHVRTAVIDSYSREVDIVTHLAA